MTRKHFNDIAEAIRLTDMPRDCKIELADNMAANCARHNPNFNASKFVQACLGA